MFERAVAIPLADVSLVRNQPAELGTDVTRRELAEALVERTKARDPVLLLGADEISDQWLLIHAREGEPACIASFKCIERGRRRNAPALQRLDEGGETNFH